MSATTLVSLEEYLSRSERPYCEFVDGALRPKSMPTTLHGVLQAFLCYLLRLQGRIPGTEIRLRIRESLILIPDVIVVDRLEHPYPVEPPQLCVEITSPENSIGALLAKCEHYHSWGVPYCWVIDPVKRTAWEYHSGIDPVPVTESLRAGGIQVDLPMLFSCFEDLEKK